MRAATHGNAVATTTMRVLDMKFRTKPIMAGVSSGTANVILGTIGARLSMAARPAAVRAAAKGTRSGPIEVDGH